MTIIFLEDKIFKSIFNLFAAGEVTLVALGPLTNLALAVKLSPNLGKNLRELVIMGGSVLGNYEGCVCLPDTVCIIRENIRYYFYHEEKYHRKTFLFLELIF